jgi:hypothetical protein
MDEANVPPARRGDVAESPRFSQSDREIICVCGISGSTHTADWDGREESALAFADHVGHETADLVTHSRYYAWLRSSHDRS